MKSNEKLPEEIVSEVVRRIDQYNENISVKRVERKEKWYVVLRIFSSEKDLLGPDTEEVFTCRRRVKQILNNSMYSDEITDSTGQGGDFE